MKKLLAIVLSLLMVMSLAVPAMAAPVTDADKGSITISNAIENITYDAYKILNLESYDVASGRATYKVADGWSDFVTAQSALLTVDATGYVTWTGDDSAATVEKFAKDALAYANARGIQPTASTTAESTTAVIDNLTLGYYVVDSSLGALCSLDTLMPNVTMKEKNTEPSLDKEVKEDSTGEFGDDNNADIGDVVEYKITITVAKNAAHHIQLVDKMSAGLTFNNDIKVDGKDLTDDIGKMGTPAVGETFVINFNDTYVDGLFAADAANSDVNTIVVTYTATVNANAIIREEGNPNEANIKYGDDYEVSSEPDETVTYVYDFVLKKYTEVDGEETLLAGAGFVLYKGTGEATQYAKFTVDGNTYKLTGWTNNKVEADTIMTNAESKITIEGLDADEYKLEETVVPDGYNKVDPDPDVVIEQDNGAVTGSVTDTDNVINVIKVENKAGSKLPETGGIGTTIFYVVGGLMMAVAVVLLVTKKKVSGK